MEPESSRGQQLSISAVVPTGADQQPPAQQRAPEEESATRTPVRQLDDTTARLVAELGRRIGELEVLTGQWPEHERRVQDALSTFDNRTSALADELRGHASGLEKLFLEHKHDIPEPAPETTRSDIVHKLDAPVDAIDTALGEALPTPAAPDAAAPVEAPRALAAHESYRSRLHRGR